MLLEWPFRYGGLIRTVWSPVSDRQAHRRDAKLSESLAFGHTHARNMGRFPQTEPAVEGNQNTSPRVNTDM